jgi:hypothetical protein
MGFHYSRVTNTDPIIAIRHDPSTRAGLIDFVQVRQMGAEEGEGDTTLLRVDRREAAALAHMLENAGGSMSFQDAVLYVSPIGRIGGSGNDCMIILSSAGENRDPIVVEAWMAAKVLYQILGL